MHFFGKKMKRAEEEEEDEMERGKGGRHSV
jgi:hypothetical protein